jgi:hypothetical protein
MRLPVSAGKDRRLRSRVSIHEAMYALRMVAAMAKIISIQRRMSTPRTSSMNYAPVSGFGL